MNYAKLLTLILLWATLLPAATPFSHFVDEYFDHLFLWSPQLGTESGFHQYDSQFPSRSKKSHESRVSDLKKMSAQLAALRPKLNASENIDADMIEAHIQSQLLDLEAIKLWKTNPMVYVELLGGSIDSLMKRNFAPAPARLVSIIERTKGFGRVLKQMQENVRTPPKEFTDLAITISEGSVGYLKEDVTKWAKEVSAGNSALYAQFEKSKADAIKQITESIQWLKKTVLPQSKGSYALGKENFLKKLRYDEMADMPLDRLLKIGENQMEKDYAHFVEVAKKIDPSKKPADVMKVISSDHPSEENLIPFAKSTVEGIREFMITKKIVGNPTSILPIVTETPSYARSGGFAMMDTPGPYESKATEAYYYVTPTEKDWDAKHKEDHLRLFNGPVMKIITIHEAYPGHYLQFLYSNQFPTKTRKLLGAGSNIEGWAHYTEQMMVEEGFGAGDPKIQLAQLAEALIRDCRFIVGIKLHTQGMTVDEGTKLFEEKSFVEHAVAFEEARRGTHDPLYLHYTLGKLLIYQLRDDYKKAKGKAYTLFNFHTDFIKQGGIPIPLIRKILLPDVPAPAL